jgi:hypothetical protein
MCGGDTSPNAVLVAPINFKGSESMKVRDLFGAVFGNAAVVCEHGRKMQRSQMFVQEW